MRRGGRWSPARSKKASCYTDSFIYMPVFDARFALMASVEECRHEGTEALNINFDHTECFKKSFTNFAVWQVLRKRLHYSSFNATQMQIRWFAINYLCKCFIRQRCYIACGKKFTTVLSHCHRKSHRTITIPGKTLCVLLHYDS
jgi:hypothetical protein